jgi:hypothetical protein
MSRKHTLLPEATGEAVSEAFEVRWTRIRKRLIYDLQAAIDEYGYEAVYFGVGCEVFPDAVDPWEGNDQ